MDCHTDLAYFLITEKARQEKIVHHVFKVSVNGGFKIQQPPHTQFDLIPVL